MEPKTAMCPENYEEMVMHLEEVYGNAYWALRNGALRERLIDQIDQAIEMLKTDLASRKPLFDGYHIP
jgi:hypothetical protein